MGTNFNPTGLRTFAEMGFPPQAYINTPQVAPAQLPQTQVPVQTPQQITVQPQVQTFPAQNVPSNNPNVNLEKTPKQDTITIAGKQIKKKTAIYTGLGMAAAIAVAGILAYRGKNKVPMPDDVKAANDVAKNFISRAKTTLENARIFREEGNESIGKINALTEEARALADNVHHKITDVVKLFSNPSDAFDGADGINKKIFPDTVRQITIMEERTPDNKRLIRRSEFDRKGILTLIEEWTADGKKNVVTVASGKVASYEEGIQELEGKTVIEKILEFENTKITKYKKGITKKGNDESADIILELIDGKIPKTYMEGYEKLTGEFEVEKIKRMLDFKNGDLYGYTEGKETQDRQLLKIQKKFNYDKSKYQEGYESNFTERTETRARTLLLDGDRARRYEEGVVCKDDKPVSVSQAIEFVKGKPQIYSENIAFSDAETKKGKIINYKEGKPISYAEGYKEIQGKPSTAERELAIMNEEWVEITTNPES